MCWVISHFWLIYLIVKTLKIYEYVILSWIPKIKESTFFIIWGFSNGPLMVSILVYKTPLIFHNPKYVSSIAIHILPVALAWNLRWNAEKYEKQWPGIFGMPLNQEIVNNTTFMDMFIPCLILYACWLTMYSSWLVCFGRFQGLKITG